MNSTVTTGYTASTPNALLIDSGAVYANYGLPAESLIGATSGGNDFSVKIKTRQPKIDGIKSKNAKGLEIITDVEVTLKANFLEVTPAILQMALIGSIDSASDPNYNIITGKTVIADSDYLKNIAIVGTLSGSTYPVVIIIKNALCLDGLQVKMEDEKDITLPVTFTGHVDPATPNLMPYEIRYPKASVGAPFAVIGTPFVDSGKIRVSFSDVVESPVPIQGFAVTSNGAANVITAATRDVNKTTDILLTLTTAPVAGQATTLAYTMPGVAANQLNSNANVLLSTFGAITVNNN